MEKKSRMGGGRRATPLPPRERRLDRGTLLFFPLSCSGNWQPWNESILKKSILVEPWLDYSTVAIPRRRCAKPPLRDFRVHKFARRRNGTRTRVT